MKSWASVEVDFFGEKHKKVIGMNTLRDTPTEDDINHFMYMLSKNISELQKDIEYQVGVEK